MKKINLLIAICCINMYGCSQTKEQKINQMNEFIDQVMLQVKHYDTQPVYNLQVNKSGCRMLVETNNMPSGILGNFFTNKGESMMMGLNRFILKSGQQNIKLKIFPRDGEEFINGFAHIDVKLYYNSNKDSGFKNYECLAKIALPENIVDKKLPYFEINIPFSANVPYDFSERLYSAVDLKKVPDIEKKLIAKFEVKRKLIIDGKEMEYNRDEVESYIVAGNMFYATKQELWDYYKVGKEIFNLNLPERDVLPFTNYEINFFADNKLATVVNKKSKEEILTVNFSYKDKPANTSVPLVLYIPKGSNEFKVW